MSQLADVNTQSSVGMFHFYDVYVALVHVCARLLSLPWGHMQMSMHNRYDFIYQLSMRNVVNACPTRTVQPAPC